MKANTGLSKSEPLVDVVIPVFNRDVLFRECLSSVLRQTYSNLCIYVIEDGSNLAQKYLPSDSSEMYLSSKLSDDSEDKHQIIRRIMYVKLNKNHGVSYCRNLGTALGKGQYIAFLDSDDLWDACKINRQVEYLQANTEFNWIHTNELWIKNGQPVQQKKEHRKQGGKFVKRMLERCLISPSAVLFKRDFFENQGWFLNHFRVAEDYELWIRLNLKYPVAFLEEPLVIKRSGDWTQLSRTQEIDRWRILALHRFYRLYKNDSEFVELYGDWRAEFIKKIKILIQGSEKHNHMKKNQIYKTWLQVVLNK